MMNKLFFTALFLLTLVSQSPAQPRVDKNSLPPIPNPFKDQPRYVKGEVLVKYRANFTQSDIKQFNQQVAGAAVKNKAQARQAFHTYYHTRSKKKLRLPDWEVLSLPAGKGALAAVAEMRGNALVEKVELNGLVHAAALSNTYTPNGAINDPYYTDGASQWWINRTRGDAAMAGNIFFGSGPDVIVAVLDTGADADHPDLAGRLVPGWNYVAGNADTDDDNTYLGDINGPLVLGHGTHVTGIICALANNAAGIAGTAWDNRVKVMPVKVLDNYASGSIADISDGIIYAADQGADIINMSFVTSTNYSLISDAVDYAGTQGVLMVAAAGNYNENMATDPYYPACYAAVMSVAATAADDFITYYTHYCDPYNADRLDCVAPGGTLEDHSPSYPEDYGVTATARTGGYSAVDGTSFASPQVAALAALIKLAWPAMTAAEIRTRILNNCDPVSGLSSAYIGQGRINIQRALSLFPTPTTTPTATVTFTRTGTATATPSATMTPTYTPSSTATGTGTCTATGTLTPTRTLTLTATPSATATLTRTFSATTTRTMVPSATASISLTATASLTHTSTPTRTRTGTSSPTPTVSPTLTHSLTPTASFTATCTPTKRALVVQANAFRAFPQPGRDFVRFAFRYTPPGNMTLKLYNPDGERVAQLQAQPLQTEGTAVVELRTAQLGPGVYFVVLELADQKGNRRIKGKIALIK